MTRPNQRAVYYVIPDGEAWHRFLSADARTRQVIARDGCFDCDEYLSRDLTMKARGYVEHEQMTIHRAHAARLPMARSNDGDVEF